MNKTQELTDLYKNSTDAVSIRELMIIQRNSDCDEYYPLIINEVRNVAIAGKDQIEIKLVDMGGENKVKSRINNKYGRGDYVRVNRVGDDFKEQLMNKFKEEGYTTSAEDYSSQSFFVYWSKKPKVTKDEFKQKLVSQRRVMAFLGAFNSIWFMGLFIYFIPPMKDFSGYVLIPTCWGIVAVVILLASAVKVEL